MNSDMCGGGWLFPDQLMPMRLVLHMSTHEYMYVLYRIASVRLDGVMITPVIMDSFYYGNQLKSWSQIIMSLMCVFIPEMRATFFKRFVGNMQNKIAT